MISFLLNPFCYTLPAQDAATGVVSDGYRRPRRRGHGRGQRRRGQGPGLGREELVDFLLRVRGQLSRRRGDGEEARDGLLVGVQAVPLGQGGGLRDAEPDGAPASVRAVPTGAPRRYAAASALGAALVWGRQQRLVVDIQTKYLIFIHRCRFLSNKMLSATSII
jgi:hypothetical protein